MKYWLEASYKVADEVMWLHMTRLILTGNLIQNKSNEQCMLRYLALHFVS